MKGMWGVAVLAAALAAPAQASRTPELGAIEVYDRTSGRTLPVHEHKGRKYVVGEPGHEYEVVVRNYSGGRVLAVTSVDGVNVVTGETASPEQSGYVLPAWGSTGIAGWRKSMAEIAAFYFTQHRNSYAARTGRPFDVGVIGVALFREKGGGRCCWPRDDAQSSNQPRSEDRAAEGAAAPSAKRQQEKLGTGHGRREESHASYTEFERASDTPDEIIAIYYDSRANLVAQGVLPRDREYAQRRPRPFPGNFAPDP